MDIARCHGWIDGQKRPCDAQYFLQRFAQGRPKSLWSKINVGKIERLMVAERVAVAGQREVYVVKADGRWHAAHDPASSMDIPGELAAALAYNAKARRFFDQIDKTHCYAHCLRGQTAKQPETRLARGEKFVAMLANSENIHG